MTTIAAPETGASTTAIVTGGERKLRRHTGSV